MRSSILWRIMEIEEGVLRRGLEADNTLQDLHNFHMIWKPSSIIVLLFIQNNSLSKNIAKTCNYYSFKIFPRFWLAKRTRIIRHNQLLMTKFGKILSLTRKWRQKCILLQVNALLTKKTSGRDWVVFIAKTKMADTSLVSSVRSTVGTRRNKTARRQLGRWHLLFGEYLRSWTNLNVNYWR